MSNKAFSKFTLKPSALSQHTANFNKKLEQLPVKKTEPIQLIKPVESLISTINENISSTTTTNTDSKVETVLKENDVDKSETSSEKEPVKEFVFGEKLTDRVINTLSEGTSSDIASSKDEKENSNISSEQALNNNVLKQSSSGLLWTENRDENKLSTSDQLEEDNNTIIKLNCKLYVLESNKASWAERGYGLFKLIDLRDGYNCKLMMWTDKCFRLILNTKLFEKMKIEKVSTKSIRLNAFDSGTIRIFLIKTGNQNDCEDLLGELLRRLKMFNEYVAKNGNNISDNNQIKDEDESFAKRETISSKNAKSIVFKCNCDFLKNESNDTIKAEIRLYSLTSVTSNSISNNHQLFLDIVNLNNDNQIYLSTYLKLVKLKAFKKDSPLEFEIGNSTDSESVRIFIDDNENIGQFLNLYNKEPKFKTNPEVSSDDEKNSDDEEKSDETDISNDSDDEDEANDVSDRRSASFCERTSEQEASQETGEIASRKRKNDEVDEDSLSNSASYTYKKQEIEASTQSENSFTQKRSVSDISDEEDTNLKKSKVLNEDSS